MTALCPAPRRGLMFLVATVLSVLTALSVLAGPVAPVGAASLPSGAPSPLPSAAPGQDDLTNEEAAEQALETVQSAIVPGTPDGPVVEDPLAHQEFVAALRDLTALQDYLDPADRRVAARLLARPTDATPGCYDTDYACFGSTPVLKLCNSMVCVHYARTGPHRVQGDNNGPGGAWNGKAGGAPDYVEFTLATLTRIAQRYIAAGYRAPVSDAGADGTAQVDIYLTDVGGGSFPLYGYCWTDEERAEHVAVSPYCVLDNDYSTRQYPTHTPAGNLRVTAAHEYFHAVQFAYDFYDDAWFQEATATWAEEVLFDSVNDNRQYLPYGPLGRPARSLDTWGGLSPYASWIFVQFLGQRYPAGEAGMPVIVREIWEKMAHSGPGSRRMYSVQAISSALRDRGSDLTTEFARFTAWNRRPRTFYAEGAAYPQARVSSTYRVGPGRTGRDVRFRLDHLSARHYRFVSDFTGVKDLRISVDLNSVQAGGYAWVLFKATGRGPQLKRIPLNALGRGSLVVPFGRAVEWVEVDAVNASARYDRCDTAPEGDGPFYTCGGVPRDDGVRQLVTVRAVNR